MTESADPAALLSLHRGTRHFAADRRGMDALRQSGRVVRLAADQIHHPDVPGECLVRLGKLRITQFLPDGREITRAVLQAGSAFATRAAGETAADPGEDLYRLPDMVIMALGDVELWALPPHTLDLAPEDPANPRSRR